MVSCVIAEFQEWQLRGKALIGEAVVVGRGAAEAAAPRHQQPEEGRRSKLHLNVSPHLSRKGIATLKAMELRFIKIYMTQCPNYWVK
jgi:hypothetical protein